MRGVVSMAAALALPLALPDGTPFPHRNLIIYLSFLCDIIHAGITGFNPAMDHS